MGFASLKTCQPVDQRNTIITKNVYNVSAVRVVLSIFQSDFNQVSHFRDSELYSYSDTTESYDILMKLWTQ